MILFITDNPYIKKTIPGCYLLYQIYDWTVYPEENEFEENIFNIKKKIKLKELSKYFKSHEEIKVIVARSNYKLIYELMLLLDTNKVTFYYWDTWEKRKEVFPDFEYCTKEFFKYLQRGYFSSIVYNQLSYFNLQRIEQFLMYVSVNLIEKKGFSNGEFEIKSFNSKDFRNRISLLSIINVISYKKDSMSYIVDKLMYHARKGHITDPFIGEFKFLDFKNDLYKLYTKYLEKEETFLFKKIKYIIYLNHKIMPIVDILKTLRFISENELIVLDSFNAASFIPFNNLELSRYIVYLDIKKWNFIYEHGDFISFNKFPALTIEELSYSCPVCGSSEYRSSPKTFWCSDNLCSFRVDRFISPAGLPKRISEWDLNRLIRHGSTIIKNKRGGYSRFYFIENDNKKGKYHVLPYIKKNDINPDKK